MKLTEKQIERLVNLIFRSLRDQSLIEFKIKESDVFTKACNYVHLEFQKEKELDGATEKMMDDLERQNPGSFQRYKMFPMLKKRLAKEKGVVLDDRVSHFVSLVVDGLWKDDLVDYSDEDKAMRMAKRAGVDFEAEINDIDSKAREKVASLKRNVMEGTPEWDVMYRKYYEEELQKRGN